MSVSGIAAYLEYGKQSNFTTALSAGASTRAFGMDQRITSLSINEGMFSLGDLNTALVQKYAFGKFEGSFGVEWTLSNPWWIDLILGNASTAGGAAPYTHTYEDSETVNSITAEVGIDTSTDRVLQLQRGTVRDVGISASIDEVVTCRGNFQFGATAATAGTSLDGSVSTDDITTPYTMVHATVENPSGTILAEVQSAELTLNPNIRMVYGLDTTAANAGFAVNAFKGRLDISGRFTLAVKNNTWWNNVRARAEPSDNTLRFKFTNGGAAGAERSVQFTVTGLGLGQHNTNISQYDLITEEIPFTGRDITAVAVNATGTPP